jgi:hypothetical protein
MMKKILIALLLCALLIVMPLSVSAEEIAPNEGEITTEGDNNTPENEMPTEGENSGDEDYEIGDVFEGEIPGVTDTETPEEEQPPIEEEPAPDNNPTSDIPPFDEYAAAVTDEVAKWITDHITDIGTIVALIGYGITLFAKFKSMIKSVTTLNNNAVTIAGQSKTSVEAVTAHDAAIVALMNKYQTCEEEKKLLMDRLTALDNYLKVNADANIEFANELAELLGLSNIPNYKKEEIGAAHLERVKAILEAKAKVEEKPAEEVEKDDEEA